MSGARSRRKGATWERALVKKFKEVMPGENIHRGFQCRSGEEAPDVDVPAFWVEAKAHNRTNIKAALEQAAEACGKGRWPLAICKDDRREPIAAMYLDDFLELVEQWWRGLDR